MENLNAISQWLSQNEAAISAFYALVAMLGVSYAALRYVFSPILVKLSGKLSGKPPATESDLKIKDESGSAAKALPINSKDQSTKIRNSHPSLAILGFKSLSSNDDDKYLALGIASEVVALITSVPDIRVSSRDTLYKWDDKDTGAKEAGAQINADYVLTGSLQKLGNRIRLIAKLTDLNADADIWTQCYDRELEDLFNVQNDIARSIVGAILGKVRLLESFGASKAPEQQLNAWGLLQKAYYFWLTNFTAENVIQATECLRKAIVLDPEYAAPKAALSHLLAVMGITHICNDYKAAIAEAEQLANAAINLAPNDISVLESAGVTLLNTGHRDRALATLRHAVKLTPLNLICRGYLSLTLGFVGGKSGAAEALTILEDNLKIAPGHPAAPWWHWFMAIANQTLGNYQASLEHCQKSILGQPGWVHTYYFMANACGELGDTDAAYKYLDIATSINPAYNTASYIENIDRITGSDDLSSAFVQGLKMLKNFG